jgi:hypothetical protein
VITSERQARRAGEGHLRAVSGKGRGIEVAPPSRRRRRAPSTRLLATAVLSRRWSCGKLRRMVILNWNGKELPSELASLPPGRYVLEPVAAVAALSKDEDEGLLRALASLDRGEGVDEEQMDAKIASILT